MKKIVSVIICICVFASLPGCGSDQYIIEKEYWKVQRHAEKIFKNPHASPPRQLERVVKLLNNFIEKYPQNKLSIDADFNIARLYIVKEEYAKARTHLEQLLNKYNKDEGICAEALFLIGNSYQIEDKWALALQEYKKIIQEYPITPRGLDIPIYIAQHYKIKYQPDKMLAAFQEAINHYRTLVNKYPNSPLAYQADNLIAQCYIALKDWQTAINSLNAIIDKYKDKIKIDNILMDMAIIYKKELEDKTKAEETLQRLLKDYPRSRLIKIATALLKEWDKE